MKMAKKNKKKKPAADNKQQAQSTPATQPAEKPRQEQEGAIITPNPLELFWEKYYKHIYAGLAIVLAIWAIVYVTQTMQESQRNETWAGIYSDSGMFKDFPNHVDAINTAAGVDLDKLKSLIADRKGQKEEAFLRIILCRHLLEKEQLEAAKIALDSLKKDFPSHPVVATRINYKFHDEPISLVDGMLAIITSNHDFKAKHKDLFSNPEPEKAFWVKVTTSKGNFTIRFFPKAAPKHVANFCRRVRDGFYTGQKVHQVGRGKTTAVPTYIQFGDRDTAKAEVAKEKWNNSERCYKETLPFERNQLYHFAGAVSALRKPGGKETSAWLIEILAEDYFANDTVNNVFGKVVEGLDVIKQMAIDAELPQNSRNEGTPVVDVPVIKEIKLEGDWSSLKLPAPVKIKKPKETKEPKKDKPAPPLDKKDK